VHTIAFPGEDAWFQDVAVQADGRIVACGDAGDDLHVHRVLPNGSADPSFGNQGSIRLQFGNGYTIGYGLAVQANDSGIIVVGTGIVRLLPNGDPDSLGFGTDGWAITPADLDSNVVFRDVIIQPDGRIVATGWTSPDPDTLIVLRLLPDGTPDSSFAQDGSLKLPVQDVSNGVALALDPDGRIVVTGSVADTVLQNTTVLWHASTRTVCPTLPSARTGSCSSPPTCSPNTASSAPAWPSGRMHASPSARHIGVLRGTASWWPVSSATTWPPAWQRTLHPTAGCTPCPPRMR
jgi:uncharacterized delta-60 repeat protein